MARGETAEELEKVCMIILGWGVIVAIDVVNRRLVTLLYKPSEPLSLARNGRPKAGRSLASENKL